MQQSQRKILSLAFGAALAAFAAGAFAADAPASEEKPLYESVYSKSYAQYFGGVGTVDAAYDGTKDIQNWKPTLVPTPNDGPKVWSNLRTIYINTALDPSNRYSSINGFVSVRFSGLNLVNDKGSKPYTFVLSDGNSDKSASRETNLAFEGSVIKRWNIVVEEPTYRKYFGIQDGERSTQHSISFVDSEFEGDIFHNSKESNASNASFPLVMEGGNNLDLALHNTKWTGATYSTLGTSYERDETRTHRTHLTLTGNSHWFVNADSFVTTLDMEDTANITIESGSQSPTSLTVGSLASTAAATVTLQNNTNFTLKGTDVSTFAETEETKSLTLRFEGLNNASVSLGDSTVSTNLVVDSSLRADNSDSQLIEKLAGTLTEDSSADVPLTFALEADAFSNAVTGGLGKASDGTFFVSHTEETINPRAKAVSDTGASLFMQWRSETDDVMRRMSAVRGGAENGLWVRHRGGRNEVGSSDFDFTSFEFGGDRVVYEGKVKALVGVALSYTDGDAKFGAGSSDADTWGLTAYGELTAEKGSYLNAALKFGKLKNEFDFDQDLDGTFRSNAWAVSLEAGHRFDLVKGLWLEPALGFTYAKVDGDRFDVGTGASVRQGDFESKVGSIGFTFGLSCPADRGEVYVRAAYMHDWDGETTTGFYSASGRETNRFDRDLGGSWYEAGIGADLRVTDALRAFAEFETAHSGEMETPFRWNLGVRYSF